MEPYCKVLVIIFKLFKIIPNTLDNWLKSKFLVKIKIFYWHILTWYWNSLMDLLIKEECAHTLHSVNNNKLYILTFFLTIYFTFVLLELSLLSQPCRWKSFFLSLRSVIANQCSYYLSRGGLWVAHSDSELFHCRYTQTQHYTHTSPKGTTHYK